VAPLRCRLIVQIAEGAELKVHPGSHGLSAAHADQLNAELTTSSRPESADDPDGVRVIALGA
jgi:hypothetical protein